MRKFDLKKTLKDPYQQMLLMNDIKKFALTILQIAIIVGVSYVILSPVIGMFVNSISSDKDAFDPMVFCFPKDPTLEKYQRVILRMNYWPTITKNSSTKNAHSIPTDFVSTRIHRYKIKRL